MLKLLLGRSGTGKSAALLRAMAGADGTRPQILIVPEQHSHDAERALCAAGGSRVSLFINLSRAAQRPMEFSIERFTIIISDFFKSSRGLLQNMPRVFLRQTAPEIDPVPP